MNDTCIFPDKAVIPADEALAEKLTSTFSLWIQLREYVQGKYPGGVAEWFYATKKSGWNYRIKDKKRAIIYLLPRDKYFVVSFVFGQKATDLILASDISDEIKENLQQAKPYMEGRGIQIEVKDETGLPDIKKLVEIKLAN